MFFCIHHHEQLTSSLIWIECNF